MKFDRFLDKTVPWLAFLVGAFLRFFPGLQAGFPLNDGGLFHSMIRDLQASQFMLPRFTTYNLSNIPYTYPPLGMYVAAILTSLLKISEVDLLRWIPAIVSSIIIPVFYRLSLQIFENKAKSLIATIFVAFLPGSFDWLIMGGGLTRSLGILFFLLAVNYVLKVFRDADNRSIWFSILFCSLAVLSHPEVGLQTMGICFLLWVLYGRNATGTKQAILVIIGTAIATSPWWLTVLIQHGPAPFLSAAQTGIREKLFASLFHSFFSTQAGIPILPTLTILGLFITLRKRSFLPAGWMFIPFILDPRNAPAVAIYASILLASEGLYFLYDAFKDLYLNSNHRQNHKQAHAYVNYAGKLISILLAIFLFWACFKSTRDFSRVSLALADRETMEWIRKNTPESSRFLLLTSDGQVNPMVDAYQEWFPSLTERHSQNTLQGLEWTMGPDFYEYSLKLMDLQACRNIDCVQEWISEGNIQIDYLLIRTKRVLPGLSDSILISEAYYLIYQTDRVAIYKYMD